MRCLAVALLASLVPVIAVAEPAAPPADPRATLEPLTRKLLDSEQATAIVIALIAPKAKPQLLAWGETVRGNGKRPDGQTVFEIGSVSKVFTGLLLAGLVVDKQVTLDTPVAKLLPPGTKLPASKRAITLLDLTTHSSGLPRMPDNFKPADARNPYADYTADRLYAFLAGATLAHEPGAGFAYSNLGVGLLGQAIATRAKSDWGALVIAQIARPLGMTSTMVTLSDDARARVAQGYDSDGEPQHAWDLVALAGAGALRSTANDLTAFVQAELAAGTTTSRLGKAMTLSQQRQRDAEDNDKIGLGWMITPDGTVWHNGQTGGYHSYVGFRPKTGLGVVVLATGSTMMIDRLGQAALASLAGEPATVTIDASPPDVAVDEATLARYVGTYNAAPGIDIAITRDGKKLYVQVPQQPRLRLHATSQKDFAVRVVPASGTFELDAKGQVTALILHQGGVDTRAARK